MTRSIYILGGPGSGKSTLMRYLIREWVPGPYIRLIDRELFGHQLINADLELGVYLGHLRPEYPGTDALSLSVAPHALRWLQTLDPQLAWVFGEGARLGHAGFLQELSVKTDLLVVHLSVAPEVSLRRRQGRPGKLLTEQYCRATATRAANTAASCREVGIPTLELDGTRDLESLEEDIHYFQ